MHKSLLNSADGPAPLVFTIDAGLTRSNGIARKSDLADNSAGAYERASAGGTAGLRVLAATKAQTGIDEFIKRLHGIIFELEGAVAPIAKRNASADAEFMRRTAKSARHAAGELQNLALFVQVCWFDDRTRAMYFPEGSGWDRVSVQLHRLGDAKAWQGGDAAWIRDEVLPTLKWAVGDLHGQPPVARARASS